MVKWTKKWLRYAEIPKFFFMMTSTTIISTQIYNVKMTSSKKSLKVKSENKWLNMVLNVDFMTSNILNMVFLFYIP
jgi:hypothetical protein